VPKKILVPEETWKDRTAYQTTARKLASLFTKNFLTFENGVSELSEPPDQEMQFEVGKTASPRAKRQSPRVSENRRRLVCGDPCLI
jgi:hypothetical protein